MSDNPTVDSLPLTNVTFLKPSYNFSFHNGTEVVGRFYFNGAQMKFEGNADESVDAFVRAFGHWFDGRLKQEREAEREACAKVCDDKVDAEYKTGKVDHNEMAWTKACAIAIRARGET